MRFFELLHRLFFGNPFPKPTPRTNTLSSPRPQTASSISPQRPLPSRPVQARQSPPSPKHVNLNLEAAQFAPISNSEAKKQAGKLGSLWTNVWFGRRDLIPPASDPRTVLIDRAMVGVGLITPDALIEIHRVGDEMARVKPDLALAAEEANKAVRQSQEEREALKKQKKLEGAERRRLHADGVAKRKATDIIFLGRGVSKCLADRRANVEKLTAAGLPILATPADVATALNLPIKRLRWLAFHADAATVSHYVRFTVPKKSGGTRELAAPHKSLARCQEWILHEILAKLPVADCAHGFVPTRNTLSNARPHVRQAVVLNLDLKDFFPTIAFRRVCGLFKNLGYSPAAAAILALLCTEAPRKTVSYAGKVFHVATGPRALPQGACTSPALSNLAARGLDSRLSKLSAKLGYVNTRYADDLTFSTSGDPSKTTGYLLARVRHITEDEGFTVNEKKTRIQRAGNQQTVTGIVVNKYPNVARKEIRNLRAILHRASKEGLAAQNRSNHPHFLSWLQGKIGYVNMINPKQGHLLKEALAKLVTA